MTPDQRLNESASAELKSCRLVLCFFPALQNFTLRSRRLASKLPYNYVVGIAVV